MTQEALKQQLLELLAALNPEVSNLKVEEKHSLISETLDSNTFENYPAIVNRLCAAIQHGRHESIWNATSDLEELLAESFDITKNPYLAAQLNNIKVHEAFQEKHLDIDELSPEQLLIVTNYQQASEAMFALLESEGE